MTIAEQLKLMGRTEGLLQGIQEGLHQGILEGQRAARQEIARQMLLRGFDKRAIMEMTGLTQDELQHLSH